MSKFFFSNSSEHLQNVIQCIKIAFFQKITKNSQAAEGFAPRPPFVIRLSNNSFAYIPLLI